MQCFQVVYTMHEMSDETPVFYLLTLALWQVSMQRQVG